MIAAEPSFAITDEELFRNSFYFINPGALHFGAEAVVFLKHIPLAFRQGYYKKAADSLRIKRFDGDEASREVLEGLFAQREDEHHFTLGGYW